MIGKDESENARREGKGEQVWGRRGQGRVQGEKGVLGGRRGGKKIGKGKGREGE